MGQFESTVPRWIYARGPKNGSNRRFDAVNDYIRDSSDRLGSFGGVL